MSGQSGGHRLCLSKLNEQLTCKLCGGYFIDATTIIECLHSFCRSCIVKYLANNKYCPICEVQVHKSRPLLNIRPDHTLQDIVYKLVPGCYQNEMRCRREFYLKHPEARSQAMSPEARGEPIESHIYSPDESLSLSLEYFNPNSKDATEMKETMIKEVVSRTLPRRYLRCPAAVTIFHLQKLIRAKYGLSDVHRVDIMYKEEPLCATYTLMDIMYIYHWRRKVPLHLSYRIFASSPKRIKLSEDNTSYQKSLLNAGIDSIESKDESNREWKEVQLKISETGVMSVTDISSPELKRASQVEDFKDEKISETNSLETVNNSVTGLKMEEKVDARASTGKEQISVDTEKMQESSKTESEKETTIVTNSSSEDNTDASILQKRDEDNESEKPKELEDLDNSKVQKEEKKVQVEPVTENKEISTNNNNNIMESKIECDKNVKNEMKTLNAGSKIDALSAKLQFQPKVGQVNNTYSKKALKDKRMVNQNTKKTEAKTSEQNSEVKCEEPKLTNIISAAQNAAAFSSVPPSVSSIQDLTPKNSNITLQSTCVQQSLSLLERRINSPDSVQRNNACGGQKTQIVKSNDATPVSVGFKTNTDSIQISTFSYTVQDLVSNSSPKSPVKNSTCTNQRNSCLSSATSTESQISSAAQFSIPSSMSIYSLKNTYAPTNSTASNRQISKTNFDISGVYSIPPCPDAIPISLMKPTIRKHEIIAKGTNLNEICAKIGTSGSKINDICAKIGENSKEKNKVEARNKPEIPDLLKIAKKDPGGTKHIPNIPNVPIYTPCNSTSENKTVYSSLKDGKVSLLSPATSAIAQKLSVKKQAQPVGYKTLRDPPKSWNPTLSKNNYVAAKNQAKEMQNVTSESSKPIQSKPAKIFKMRNMPRYLGNPASGVKPMYGISETKEKESNNTKASTLSMMKIDPKILSPIVSTVNSPIVSPPPYSPNARSYQNTPFPRNTGSPISPRNSPVNMLSTNPFIPSPTPNTNPRLIYSHFPPPFPDASRFPNPLIRSPIGIPPPSAFHSSLPPSINKLYQRTSYIPQTTNQGYSPVSQPPTVQRIPPSTHSSPKTSSPNVISSSGFNPSKSEAQTSIENSNLQFTKEVNAFNLSKTGGTDFPKSEVKNCKSEVSKNENEEKRWEETKESGLIAKVNGDVASENIEKGKKEEIEKVQTKTVTEPVSTTETVSNALQTEAASEEVVKSGEQNQDKKCETQRSKGES